MGAYKLVAAHDGHQTKWLDSVLLGVKSRPVGLAASVTKDDVRVGVGIQVLLASSVGLEDILERGDGLRIAGGAAATVVGRAVLDTVAVDVQVDERARLALEVDDVVVGLVVATVAGSWEKVRMASGYQQPKLGHLLPRTSSPALKKPLARGWSHWPLPRTLSTKLRTLAGTSRAITPVASSAAAMEVDVLRGAMFEIVKRVYIGE
jgi:hypothetical protein